MKNPFSKRKTLNSNPARQYAVRDPPTFLVPRLFVLPALARQATKNTIAQEIVMTAPNVRHANDVNRTGGHRIAGSAFGQMRKGACQFVTRETPFT